MNCIPLVDFLDKNLEKWWDKPEVTNALLTDRTYHLINLELFRTGSLEISNKTSLDLNEEYKSCQLSYYDFYQEKYGIELKHPDLPLFSCGDGFDTFYPAEIINLEIQTSLATPEKKPLNIYPCKSKQLITYLDHKLGEDWKTNPERAGQMLQNMDVQLEIQNKVIFANLIIGRKTAATEIKYKEEIISYQQYFEKVHNYKIKETSIPLITVNSLESKKFHWPAELISVILY